MRRFGLKVVIAAVSGWVGAFRLCGTILLAVALGQLHAQSEGPISPSASTTFTFVPGHYYTSDTDSPVITEYDLTGTVVASHVPPSQLAKDARGLAFGPDGLLYILLSRDTGFSVVVMRSDGSLTFDIYSAPVPTFANVSYGKIALDDQYLYVCGGDQLTRFLIGSQGFVTTIYTEFGIFEAMSPE